MYSCEPLHMDKQRLDDQLEPIYNGSVLIQDVAWKTRQEQWPIKMGGERGLGKSALAARHDDDEGCWNTYCDMYCTCLFSSIRYN